MAKSKGGEESNDSFNQVKGERFTTLSPVIDDDHGKAVNYGPFNGEVPADNAGILGGKGNGKG